MKDVPEVESGKWIWTKNIFVRKNYNKIRCQE
jgi:hypothetical protein